jgi:hypothetical protein
MNILTVNLLFSTLVFWLAARLYLLPKLPALRPRVVLPPMLLLHAFRHLGLMFLAPGATYAGIPAQFAYPAAFGDLLAALLGRRDCGGNQTGPRRPAARVDFQCGGYGGPARGDNAGYAVWRVGVHGSGLLDTRVLGTRVAGDTLHYLCIFMEILVGRESRGGEEWRFLKLKCGNVGRVSVFRVTRQALPSNTTPF